MSFSISLHLILYPTKAEARLTILALRIWLSPLPHLGATGTCGPHSAFTRVQRKRYYPQGHLFSLISYLIRSEKKFKGQRDDSARKTLTLQEQGHDSNPGAL